VRKSAEAVAPAFDLVPLDFSTAPPIERKALETKKKEKLPKPTENSASPTPAANKAERSEAKKKEKQGTVAGKDEKKKAADGPKAASAANEDAGSPIPSMIDLRVGHILEGMSDRFSRCIFLTHEQSKSTLMPMVFMSRHAASVV
jgi:aminoacyl tRNA synthase complex-interacting multifunctional protein 1